MNTTTLKQKAYQFLYFFPNIGIAKTDDESRQLQIRFLNSQALLMSTGGLMWGSISLYFNLYLAAAVPFTYFILTVLNLTYFYFSRNFKTVRFFQVLISLLLPFMFQFSLGGIVSSGGMMIWSLLALVGSMSF